MFDWLDLEENEEIVLKKHNEHTKIIMKKGDIKDSIINLAVITKEDRESLDSWSIYEFIRGLVKQTRDKYAEALRKREEDRKQNNP